MKCRLCDRATAPGGGKLCFDCTKALNRARGATLRKLASAQTERTGTSAAINLPLTVDRPAPPASPAGRRAAWAAIGLVAVAIAYFAQSELTGPGNADATVVDRLPSAAAPPPVVEASALVPYIEEPSWTAAENASNGPGGAAVAKVEANAAKPQASAAGTRKGAKPKNANQDAAVSPPVASVIETTATPVPEPAQQLARASVPPPQPVDGGQVLAGAMEKCGKENLLTKFICEQKTYFEYCEDKWDKDPRCLRKSANNR